LLWINALILPSLGYSSIADFRISSRSDIENTSKLLCQLPGQPAFLVSHFDHFEANSGCSPVHYSVPMTRKFCVKVSVLEVDPGIFIILSNSSQGC